MLQLPLANACATAMPGVRFAPARRRTHPPFAPSPGLRSLAYGLVKYPLLSRYAVPWHWPRGAQLDGWERIALASRSGATLAALYGAAEAERKGVVVCAHPLRKAAKGYFLSSGRAALLRRNGYAVLLFDFNGFGESSQGDFNYAHDVSAAADYASERANGLPVHALAACFGAVWTLAAATLDHPFSAIVLESPLTTLHEFYARRPAANVFFKLLRRFFPRSAANATPIHCAGTLAGMPQLLIIGGLDDTVALPDMSRRLYEACNLPPTARRVWYVEGAAHLRAFETAPHEYEEHVTGFLAGAARSDARLLNALAAR
jgi:alpha-beta hydrolase superfamily lysophospholipase